MFTPPALSAEAVAVMTAHSFATLVSHGPGGLRATHLPFLYQPATAERPHGTLRSHLARANPHGRELGSGAEVLVIFEGEHGYISPTWYASPAAQNVPTWNYEVVHAYGVPRVIEAEAAVAELLHRTVAAYERAGSGYDSRALPAETLSRHQQALVAFEIPIGRVEAKFKLGQNRSAADLRGVLAALTRENDSRARGLAGAMERANHAKLEGDPANQPQGD